MIRCMRRFLRPYRLRVALLCVATVVSAVLQVANALFTRDVVDAALVAPDRLPVAGMWLIGNLLALVALHGFSSWLSGSTSDACIADLRCRLLRSVSLGEDESRYQYHSGSLLNRAMEDVRTLCDGMIHALPGLVGQVARLAAGFCAVLLLYPGIAGFVLLAAAAAICVAAVLRPLLKKHHKNVRRADEQMMSCMQEDLRQLELVKSLGAEEQMLHRFHETVKNSLWAKRLRRFLTVGINTMIQGVSNLATAVVLLWGAGQVAQGVLSYGSLTAMLQLLGMLRNPVLGLSGLWTRLTAVEVASERLETLLEEPETVEKAEVGEVRSILFDRVTFAYPGEDEPVLKNYSAEFSLEKWLCLSGVSGRGKSTLFKLILGLYRPQEGGVYLRTEAGLVPCGPQTRHLFAYVPQDYALLSGTVMENLALVAPEAGEEEHKKALELACAEFVFGLSEGENTQVRENNDGLSKGQLQRIAVARALLMERPILLMDECTSALDGGTEKEMLQNLNKLSTKAILVTHRPEALEGLHGVSRVEMEL